MKLLDIDTQEVNDVVVDVYDLRHLDLSACLELLGGYQKVKGSASDTEDCEAGDGFPGVLNELQDIEDR